MKNLKEFLVFCLSTALSLSLLAACGKPQTPMAGAETPAEPSSAASEGSLRVMASFYPMYDFAQKIGGDKVTVTNMVPAGTEPHDWEPSPSDIVALEQADVFVYSGAGMEHWVEDVLASLDNQSLVTVEAPMALRCWRGTTIITRTRKKRSTNMRMSTSMKRGAAMIPTSGSLR